MLDPPFAVRDQDRWVARFLELVLGITLVASAYLTDHTDAQRIDLGVVGCAMILVAFVAMLFDGRARLVNVALAGWLIASTFVLPSDMEAILVDVCVAIVALGLATVPSGRAPRMLERWEYRRRAPV